MKDLTKVHIHGVNQFFSTNPHCEHMGAMMACGISFYATLHRHIHHSIVCHMFTCGSGVSVNMPYSKERSLRDGLRGKGSITAQRLHCADRGPRCHGNDSEVIDIISESSQEPSHNSAKVLDVCTVEKLAPNVPGAVFLHAYSTLCIQYVEIRLAAYCFVFIPYSPLSFFSYFVKSAL